jgi:hypothetical protein
MAGSLAAEPELLWRLGYGGVSGTEINANAVD